MRTLAVINQKGGVGKTTTTVNVAAALADSGCRVLLVDLDPQCHATLHLGFEAGGEDTTTYDVLVRGAELSQAARSVREGLTLVPSHLDLVGAEVELVERVDRLQILHNALRPVSTQYDVCLIDCPPSLGLATVNALAATDDVIIPLQPHFLALQGLGRLLETVTLVRDLMRPALRVAGVVLCMYDSGTRLAQEVVDDVKSFLEQADAASVWYQARVFDTRIRRNIKLAESPSFGQTIFEYAPDSNGAEDYLRLASEILDLVTDSPPPTPATALVLEEEPPRLASAAAQVISAPPDATPIAERIVAASADGAGMEASPASVETSDVVAAPVTPPPADESLAAAETFAAAESLAAADPRPSAEDRTPATAERTSTQ